MFGYVNIDKGELKVKDYENYKAVYCSLCKTLGREYTFLSRFLLSYDMTYFAILLLSQEESCFSLKKGRCRFNPAKSCNYLCGLQPGNVLSRASALTVITAYYKLLDNIDDSGIFGKIFLNLLRPYFSLVKRKASRKFPEYVKLSEEMYLSQRKAEEDRLSTDECAEPTAHFLSEVLALSAKDNSTERIFRELGYHLGKWIYLMDAADDFEKDIRKKRFNPLVANVSETRETAVNYAAQLMSQSVYMVTTAHRLLSFSCYGDVLDNIILLGLPLKQDIVIRREKGKCK